MGETRPLDRTTVMGRSVIDGVPIQIEDLQCAPESEFPLGHKMALEWGHRTTLAVPLRRENRSLGAILLRWPEVRLFSEKQISLLKDERRFLECGQHVIVPLSAARHKLGGPELLAKHLGVEDAALRAWIDGEQVPPAEIIHKAADLVLGDGLN